MHVVVCLCLLVRAHNDAWCIENPATSRLWLAPRIRRLGQLRGVEKVMTDMCQWGSSWRKSTSLWAWGLDLASFQDVRCQGSKRGTCSRTGLPHFRLEGKDSAGNWKTKRGEVYPTPLAVALARSFANVMVARIAARFEEMIGNASLFR